MRTIGVPTPKYPKKMMAVMVFFITALIINIPFSFYRQDLMVKYGRQLESPTVNTVLFHLLND